MRRGLTLGLLALGLLAGCPASQPGGDEATRAEAADADLAPDFTLPDLEGNEVSLRDFRGRTVVIDFWATWCTPCIYQIPVLNEFHEEYRDDGVVVLGIAVDAEGREVVAPFAKQHGIRYPVLLGTESVARRYGAPGFPALVVVGPDGRIESLHVGLIEREALESIVADVKGGATPPA